ncbi:hypothetical protein [Actinomadura sp. 7K534]|uniref:hypothetical protein n=1 Tax=Actinomadura sp. 7K534 TaxID=2530366 RepID=UPI0010493EF8|nr:hypothetical protein [Actinomadura sp. 7K534]TDB98847.1 hypothetical protein E1266_01710 [Actinomadura sp. 7K534]
MTSNVSAARRGLAWLNTRGHKTAVTVFGIIVVAHWAEHILQAIQIWVLGWSKPEARGVLGIPFPWLVESEWMHYGYAIVMLAGFFLLLPGFVGRSRNWWALALGIQFWHHIEHLALLIQALTDSNLAGKPVPTSFIQLLVPRVELHLFYNAVVTVPMIVAMILHRRANSAERAIMECLCAVEVKPKQKVGV